MEILYQAELMFVLCILTIVFMHYDGFVHRFVRPFPLLWCFVDFFYPKNLNNVWWKSSTPPLNVKFVIKKSEEILILSSYLKRLKLSFFLLVKVLNVKFKVTNIRKKYINCSSWKMCVAIHNPLLLLLLLWLFI